MRYSDILIFLGNSYATFEETLFYRNPSLATKVGKRRSSQSYEPSSLTASLAFRSASHLARLSLESFKKISLCSVLCSFAFDLASLLRFSIFFTLSMSRVKLEGHDFLLPTVLLKYVARARSVICPSGESAEDG